jgi:hypothetical protein
MLRVYPDYAEGIRTKKQNKEESTDKRECSPLECQLSKGACPKFAA